MTRECALLGCCHDLLALRAMRRRRHRRIACELELLPLAKHPFQEFSLFAGQDEAHQSRFKRFFVPSKHEVGVLRANFFARAKKAGKGECAASVSPRPIAVYVGEPALELKSVRMARRTAAHRGRVAGWVLTRR